MLFGLAMNKKIASFDKHRHMDDMDHHEKYFPKSGLNLQLPGIS
jgi:hypothetical protein